MPKVFVCYRREDSADVSGRIRDRLATRFGDDAVFLDVDSVPYGVDYRHHLLDWIAHCDVVLAVIGREWLAASYGKGDRQGTRRLDNPVDPVRLELTTALQAGVPVMPVLVRGAAMPEADELPEALQGLADRNAGEVRSGREFGTDVQRLIREIERLPPTTREPEPSASARQRSSPRRPRLIGPMNLGFEMPSFDGRPVGWSNSIGFVDRVSSRYDMQVALRAGPPGGQCLRVLNNDAEPPEFGSVMQRWPVPVALIGSRFRVEAELRGEDLAHWAGLWLRVDGPDKHLFFDNMSKRPLCGSTSWSVYRIEAPIDAEAEWINYGVLLVGRGTLYADSFRLFLQTGTGPWTLLAEE